MTSSPEIRGAAEGNMRYIWRQVGRNDVGRKTLAESLKEMSVSDVARLKGAGAEGLFGDPEKLLGAIADPKNSNEELDHMLRIAYSAESSPYLQPQQQAAIKRSLDQLRKEGTITAEQDRNIKEEMRYGRSLDDAERIRMNAPPGGLGGPAGPGGPGGPGS